MKYKPTVAALTLATAFNAVSTLMVDRAYEPPNIPFWTRFDFPNRDEIEADEKYWRQRLQPDKYQTAQKISTYVDLWDIDSHPLSYPVAFYLGMPTLSEIAFGHGEYSDITAMFQQQVCFLSDQETETTSHYDLSVKEYYDSSIEITFTQGRYAGSVVIFSNTDRNMFINYYAVRGDDWVLYSRPGSFVSQEVRPAYKHTASLEDVLNFADMLDFDSADIRADLATGSLLINDGEGSELYLSLSKGAFKTTGLKWGFVEFDFTPSDDTIRRYVAPLVAGSPEGSYVEDQMLHNPQLCTYGIVPIKPYEAPPSTGPLPQPGMTL
jgi:hypothetical protein